MSDKTEVTGYVAVKMQPHFIYRESLSDSPEAALNCACLRYGYSTHDEARADGWRTEAAILSLRVCFPSEGN